APAPPVEEPDGTPWDPQAPLWEEEEEEEEFTEAELTWGTAAAVDKAADAKAADAKAGDAKAGDAKVEPDKAGSVKAEDAKGGDTKVGDAKAGGSKGVDGKTPVEAPKEVAEAAKDVADAAKEVAAAGQEAADTRSEDAAVSNGEGGGGDDDDGAGKGGSGDGSGDKGDGGDEEEEEPTNAAEELLAVLPDEHREVIEKAAADENVSRMARITGILSDMLSRSVTTLLNAIPVPVLVSFIGVFTTYMGHRFQRYQASESAKRKARAAERDARSRQEAEMAAFYSDFTGPLLRASAKLQERLHCIAAIKARALAADAAVGVPGDGRDGDGGGGGGLLLSDEVRDPMHTAYLLCRYFGVLERLKGGSQAMDFGRPAADRIFLNLVGRVQGVLSASDDGLARLQRSELDFSASSGRPAPLPAGPLRVATHHQRVVGELMLRSRWFPDAPEGDVTGETAGRPGQHMALLPYHEWCKLLDTEAEMQRWMRPLVSEAWRLVHHMDPPPGVVPPPVLADAVAVGTSSGGGGGGGGGNDGSGGGGGGGRRRGRRAGTPTLGPLGALPARCVTPFFGRPPAAPPTPTADPATRRNVRTELADPSAAPVELARIFFLHDALVDLVDFLDPPPNCRFIPAARRKRLRLAGAPARPDTPMPHSLALLYQELADVHSGHIPKRLDNHRRWGSSAVEVYVKAPVWPGGAATDAAGAGAAPTADAAAVSFAADASHVGAGAALDSGALGDCPDSQRVLMALEELKVPYTLHKVNTLVQPPWFHLLSVEGRVPLLYHEGRLIDTAPHIITYLCRRFPHASAVKRRAALPLVLSEGQLTAFGRVGRAWLAGAPGVGTADVEGALAVVESVLAANAALRQGPFLGGSVLAWEDLALLPPLHHLAVAAATVRGWVLPPGLPHTRAYLAAGRRKRSFVKAAPTTAAISAGT
ncbi:hypothetical protein BU14_1972s0001, partial [Porphyra umbilicalis]